jgi:hypothetical protein
MPIQLTTPDVRSAEGPACGPQRIRTRTSAAGCTRQRFARVPGRARSRPQARPRLRLFAELEEGAAQSLSRVISVGDPAGLGPGRAPLIAYGGLNGRRLTLTSDEAYGLGDERRLRAPRPS